VAPLTFVAMVTISDGGADGAIGMTSGARERHTKLQDCGQRAPDVLLKV
jgi:hypothetical protein